MHWQDSVIWAVAIVMIGLVLVAIIVSVMRVGQTAVASEATIKSETRLIELTEQASSAQATTATQLAEIQVAISDIRTRLVSIERMMSEVG